MLGGETQLRGEGGGGGAVATFKPNAHAGHGADGKLIGRVGR
tara:strand:+ start:308 stop:433 length:126 start_codon:yes stop_codon:yes gene_type:complete